MYKHKINAFTLVELIVVIVILSILATIAFLSFNSYSSSSRDSVRLSDINSLNKSLELFNVNASKYPDPTNVYTRVVYSGGVIFEQGSAGDSVLTAVQKVNKKPIDPLDSSEYTYSTNLLRTSFQLKGELENKPSTGYNGVRNYKGEVISGNGILSSIFPLTRGNTRGLFDGIETLNQTNADSGSGSRICYVKGNFNGLIEKTNTGNTNYILAVPGLIVNEKNNLNLDYNTLSGKVVCNGMNNPCIVTYNPMPVFIGSGNSVPTTSEDITNIMTNLQNAYSGSNAATTSPVISNLLNSTGTALVSLGSSVVSKVGVGSVGGVVASPASSCSGSISDSNGISTATGEVSGVSWHYSGTPGVCSWNCKSGYSWDGVSNSCLLDCPTGFIRVPGNTDFSQATFCVAKYEMKQDVGDAGSWNGTAGILGPIGTSVSPYCTYSNNCNSLVSRNFTGAIISKPDGYPIVWINQYNAIEACKSMGTGYHLITNNERMTIARNIEVQNSNWSGGIIGTTLNRGQSNGVWQSGTGTMPATMGEYGSPNTGFINKRTHTLSNGQIIRDFAGNAWENVNKANNLDGSNYDSNSFGLESACNNGAWNWWSWYSNDGVAECIFKNGYSRALYGSSGSYNGSNGAGRIYATSTEGINSVFARGGRWNDSANAGVFSLMLWDASSSSATVGFRCSK